MTTPRDDSDLRRLLEEAVSDVHPSSGTAEIRARSRRTSAGRWLPLTLAAAVVTVLVIGGAAWLGGQSDDPPAAGPGAPSTTTSQPSAPAADEGRTELLPVYYVGDTAAGPRLFKETHEVKGITDTSLRAAVQEVLSGRPHDPDYGVWAPPDGVVAGAFSDGSTLTIDLSEPLARPTGMDDETARIALQSLIWTAAEQQTGSAMRFMVDGRPAPEVLGIDTTSPIERASADSVLSTISIDGPIEGATVPTRFQVTGRAATFEANVVWELKRGDQVVRNGFTTAQECCTLSPYTFTVTATPGDYTLVVHDTDESDGEGIGTSEDTKSITVR
jgi:hypothetical protein